VKARRMSAPAAVGALIVLASLAAILPSTASTLAATGGSQRLLSPPTVVSIRSIVRAGGGDHAPRRAGKPVISMEFEKDANRAGVSVPYASLGGARAKGSAVVAGGRASQGFPGLDIVQQENAGTGDYEGTGAGLEPPDQALCVGNGFVMEGVNGAWRVYNARGVALTPPINTAQFFKEPPFSPAGPTSFLSDPKCIYDAATKRFFATSLQADMPTNGVFGRAHNIVAVSKTSDPRKDWYVYRFDVTDDGLMGTPQHPTCPCIGDQPLIGVDRYGFYISTNEYSDLEIVPIEPPPLTKDAITRAYTLPDFRNGQAQLYAVSKSKLIRGQAAPVVELDTADIPLPPGAEAGSLWSSLQPAFQPPGDGSTLPGNGVEYFLSRFPKIDYSTAPSRQIEVWAWTNTASLNTASPRLTLQHVSLRTSDTYTYPDSASQKDGPKPVGDSCLPLPCEVEKLNANDDRMNQVMLTNGHLWSAINTMLPPINAASNGREAEPRTGIMYFDVRPAIVGGKLRATMTRDGYINVPRQSVIFPSIGASPRGPVVMSFTLSGLDRYPSAAWTRLDGVPKGGAPVVHVSAPGIKPEDGFSGYCLGGVLPLTNLLGECTAGKARWGDYSASVVDEHGCVWSGVEYISGLRASEFVGNWSTFVARIAVPGCDEPRLTPTEKALTLTPRLAPCQPLFTDPAGDDDFTQSGAFKGQNAQMDIVKGDIKLAANGRSITTTLTIKNLTKDPASPGATENEYYLLWRYKDTTYFSHVEVDATGSVTYLDGTVDGNLYNDRFDGPADTGSFRAGPNGTVVVNVPLDRVGKPPLGAILEKPFGETRALIGAAGTGSLQPVDTAGPRYDYKIGQRCTAAAAAGTATSVRGSQIRGSFLPATGIADGVSAAVGLLLIALASGIAGRVRRAR
jgi:hypothetical protein